MRALVVLGCLWSAAAFAQTVPFLEERDGSFTSWDKLAQVRADARGVHVTFLDLEERPVQLRFGVAGEPFEVAGLSASPVDVGFYVGSAELERRQAFDVLEARIRDGRMVLTRAPNGVHYTLALDTASALQTLRLVHEGVDAVAIADDGSLRITVGRSVLTESAPRCYQRYSGAPASVACTFADVRGSAETGFTYSVRAFGADPVRPMEVDPYFEWNRYLGPEMAKLSSVSADPQNNGAVYTSNLRGTAQPDGGIGADIVVGWVFADGSHQRIRVLSGNGRDESADSVVDNQGRVVVVGYSWSANYPTAGGGPASTTVPPDGIFSALDQLGTLTSSGAIASRTTGAQEGLLSVAHLGGNDFIFGGAVYADYGAAISPYNGAADGLLLRVQLFDQFSDTGKWARHIGGQGDDVITSVDVHPNGSVYAGGYSRSASFAGGAANVGSSRAFLVEIAPDAGFNPSNAIFVGPDAGNVNIRIRRGKGTQVFLAGDFLSQSTISTAPRSDGSAQRQGSGTVDVFVAKTNLGADGGRVLEWVDTHAGGGDDWLMDLAVDPRGGPLLVGTSGSSSGVPFADFDAGFGFYGQTMMGQGGNYLMQLYSDGRFRHAGRFGGRDSIGSSADMNDDGTLWVGVTYPPNAGFYVPNAPTFSPDGGGYTAANEAATVFKFQIPHLGPALTVNVGDGGLHPRDVPFTASFAAMEPTPVPISRANAWFNSDSAPGQVAFTTFTADGGSSLQGNLTWPADSGLPGDTWTMTVRAWNADNYETELTLPFALTPVPGSEDAGLDGGESDGGAQPIDDGGLLADGGVGGEDETGVSPIGFSCGCEASSGVPLLVMGLAALFARRRRR